MQNFKYNGVKDEKKLIGYIKAKNTKDAIEQLNSIGIDVKNIEEVSEKTLNNVSDKKILNYKAFVNTDKTTQIEGIILAKDPQDAYNKLSNEFKFYDIEIEDGSAFIIYTTKKNNNNFLLEIYSLSKWILFFFSVYLFSINTNIFTLNYMYNNVNVLSIFVLFLFIIFIIFDYNINKAMWMQVHDIYSYISFISFVFIFILGMLYCIGHFFYNYTFYTELPIIILSIVYFISTSITEEIFSDIVISNKK